MKGWLAGLALIGALSQAVHADEAGDYGPDWPVCQNLNADPQMEIAACGRLIDAGRLSPMHLSWAYNDRATAWLDLRRPDLAWQDFQNSIKADPANHAAYYNLAYLYYRAGRFKEAVETYDKAIALKPGVHGVYCNRGAALEALGRVDAAVASYQRELADAPNDDCALYRLTELARNTHRESLALEALDRALAADPGDSESYHRRGIIYSDTGQFDRALSDLGEAIRLNPREEGALNSRALVYSALGQYQAALDDLDQAIALAPDDPKNYYVRAKAYFLSGDYKRAAEDCERRRTIMTQDSACPDLQWRIAMMAGNFNAAVGYADTMVSAQAKQFLLYRGVAHFAAGDLMKAAGDFENYTEVAPGDPYGWLWLYLTDRELGKDDAPKLKDIAARRDAWPEIIIRHIAGTASAEDVLASVEVPDEKIKQLRLAEANFYLGELASLSGDAPRAEAMFRSVVAAGRVEVDPSHFLPVYKSDNDLELSLANAALHGKGL